MLENVNSYHIIAQPQSGGSIATRIAMPTNCNVAANKATTPTLEECF